jgi:hypothetical protein
MIGRVSRRLRLRSLAALAVLAAAAVLAAGCGADANDAVATIESVATTTAPEPDTTTAPEPDATTSTTTVPATTVPGAKTITIVIKDGVPVGGIKRATLAKGDAVVLVVHSDVDDEVHLHGYNFATDVAAGGVGQIDFVASTPGRFEAELEQRGVKIAELTVTP